MYISIDLGGTNTRLAVSLDHKSISKKVRFPTKNSFEEQITEMKKEIDNLTENNIPEALCIGVPGFVDYAQNVIRKVVNVSYLTDFNPKSLGIDTKAYVANDAALGGLGETMYGVGANYKVLAYITLSTGVGGIRVSDKKIDISQSFSEPGHIIVGDLASTSVLTGQQGSWDSFVSGVNFMNKYNIHPKECMDKKIWAEYGDNVAKGLINVVALWAPAVIVLGGSMTEKFELYEEAMNISLTKHNADIFDLPPVLKSNLGHDNGLLGGFEFINQRLAG